jgi:hypothetical protein
MSEASQATSLTSLTCSGVVMRAAAGAEGLPATAKKLECRAASCLESDSGCERVPNTVLRRLLSRLLPPQHKRRIHQRRAKKEHVRVGRRHTAGDERCA